MGIVTSKNRDRIGGADSHATNPVSILIDSR